MSLIQENRIASLSTPLGPNALVLDRVMVSEHLNQPFYIEADLLSEDLEIKFEDIIGQSVTITMLTRQDEKRFFNGIVSRFTQMGMESRFAAYHAVIVPKVWVLSRTVRSRIFQNKSVPDIVQEVLKEAGVAFEMSINAGSYPPLIYCVQYRESDLNFIHRLLEHEGLYYFFKHTDGNHSLVLTDSIGAHEVLLGQYGEIAFRPYTGRPTGSEFVFDWVLDKNLLPGTYTHTDFDFETPKKSLMVRSQKTREHAMATGEVYDFPGLHTSPGLGEQRARVRIEELQARYEEAKGKADARGLQCGFVFDLIDHPRGDQNRKYLVTSAVHTIQLDALESGDTDRGSPYHCSFTAMPASEAFRPQRMTPKPIVQGPQTAMVVGPAGEEIYTDNFGRVKVQFHWDREGHLNENSSCWVRVSHTWAGKGWGGINIPRIGQEVIVDFIEGDPDHPIIIGRVYNGESTPPFPLPAKKMVSGVKSNSTPGGGGYNEISLNDTKGTEKIIVHGQYDMDTTVLHDDTKTVGHDETATIGNNREVTVAMKHTETVGTDQTKTIGKNRNVTVGVNETVTIANSQTLSVGISRSTSVGGSDNTKVGGVRSATIGGAESLTAAGAITVTGGAAISISAGGVITITAGGAMTITAGAALAIQAAGAIALTAPAILLNGAPVAPRPPGVPI